MKSNFVLLLSILFLFSCSEEPKEQNLDNKIKQEHNEEIDSSWKGESELYFDSLLVEIVTDQALGLDSATINFINALANAGDDLNDEFGEDFDLEEYFAVEDSSLITLNIISRLPSTKISIYNLVDELLFDTVLNVDSLQFKDLAVNSNFLIQFEKEGYPSKAILLTPGNYDYIVPTEIEIAPSMRPLSDYNSLTPHNPFNYPVAIVMADDSGYLQYDHNYISQRIEVIETFLKKPEQ